MSRTLYTVALFSIVLLLPACGGGGGGGGAPADSTYRVTYDGNGNTSGAVPVDSNQYAQGATVTVLGNPNNLYRAGYSLAGWSTQADGGGAQYSLGATFTMGSSNVTLYAKWGDPVAPKLSGLTPASTSIPTGGTATFTVTLDAPATAGGIAIALNASSGTVPASVTIAEGQSAASFEFTAAANVGNAMVTATLDTDVALSTVHVVTLLVINEIDYDQVSYDTAEFVEIYNPTSSAVDLSEMALIFVNGANFNDEYLRVDLASAGVLAAGQYLVVAAPGLSVAPGAAVIRFANPSNNIQNGVPDAVGLINFRTGLVDALSYGGAVTLGSINFVEGSATPVVDSNSVAGSLGRSPNGTDTNNAASDWVFIPTPTPGAAN